jgi:Fic family protein
MNNLDKCIEELPVFLYDVIAQIDELNEQLRNKQSVNLDVLEQFRKSKALFAIKEKDDTTAEDIRGYTELLQNIFLHYADIVISEKTILYMHEELLKYSEQHKLHRGKYKLIDNKFEGKNSKGDVLGVLVEGIPASLTPKALNDLVNWLNNTIEMDIYHPLVLISAFIAGFLKVHPFTNGNGRLSRLLTDLLLLQAGYDFVLYYPNEKIIDAGRREYYLALSNSQKTFGTESESILTWTEYLLKIVHEQAKQAIALRADLDAKVS